MEHPPINSHNEEEDKPFGEITFEQLSECASLLALSLVHQRAKFGLVPIAQPASEFGAAQTESGSIDLLAEGQQTLKEALAHIKALSSLKRDHWSGNRVQKEKFEEKRQQIRICISAPISVILPNTTTLVKASLENISWGGAAFRVDRFIGDVGDCIHVVLPGFRGQRITVQGEILRASNDSDGQKYVVRFSKLRTADETILQQVLESLAESGEDNGRRTYARLARRIDIQYDDANEMRATLEDISTGGLGLTIPEPMKLEQSLLVAISSTDEQYELLLRARVVRQQVVYFSELQMFRVGLEFEHPTKDIRKRVSKLIRSIATVNRSATN